MKKYIILIIILVIIIIMSCLYAYQTYNKNIQELKNYNNNFEQYKENEIQGTQIATIINKAVSLNKQNNVAKDEKENYIENEESSIKIDIHIKDNNTTFSMESIYSLGVERFINSFSLETFKINKIEYHQKTKKVKYILIEQQ